MNANVSHELNGLAPQEATPTETESFNPLLLVQEEQNLFPTSDEIKLFFRPKDKFQGEGAGRTEWLNPDEFRDLVKTSTALIQNVRTGEVRPFLLRLTVKNAVAGVQVPTGRALRHDNVHVERLTGLPLGGGMDKTDRKAVEDLKMLTAAALGFQAEQEMYDQAARLAGPAGVSPAKILQLEGPSVWAEGKLLVNLLFQLVPKLNLAPVTELRPEPESGVFISPQVDKWLDKVSQHPAVRAFMTLANLWTAASGQLQQEVQGTRPAINAQSSGGESQLPPGGSQQPERQNPKGQKNMWAGIVTLLAINGINVVAEENNWLAKWLSGGGGCNPDGSQLQNPQEWEVIATATPEFSRYSAQSINVSGEVELITKGQKINPSATAIPEVIGTANPEQKLVELHRIWQDEAKVIPGMEEVENPQISAFLVTDSLGADESIILTQNPKTQQIYIIARYVGDETAEKIAVGAPYYGKFTMGENGAIAGIHTYYFAGDRKIPVVDWTENGFEFIGVNGRRIPLTEIIVRLGEKDGGSGGKLLSLVPPVGVEFYSNLPAGSVVDTETGTITDPNGLVLWELKKDQWVTPPLREENLKAGRWGNYTFKENEAGYYEMFDKRGNIIPETLFYQDGTSARKITVDGKEMTLVQPWQEISATEKKLIWSVWEYDGVAWSEPITNPAPKSVEKAAEFYKFYNQGVIQGHPKEQQMWETVFMTMDMVMVGYDRESEFKGVFVDGKEVDMTPQVWAIMDAWGYGITFLPTLTNYDDRFDEQHCNARPMQIILDKWLGVRVYDTGGKLVVDAVQIPGVAKNYPNKIINWYALVNKKDLGAILPYLTKEEKGKLFPILIHMSQLPEGYPFEKAIDATPELKKLTHEDWHISDKPLREIVARLNQWFFAKYDQAAFDKMNQLPDLNRVFFDLGIVWDSEY